MDFLCLGQHSPVDFVDEAKLLEVAEAWKIYSCYTTTLLSAVADKRHLENKEFLESVAVLCRHGLFSLVTDSFLNSIETSFRKQHASIFWRHFDGFTNLKVAKNNTGGTRKMNKWIQSILPRALEEICCAKSSLQDLLALLVCAVQAATAVVATGLVSELSNQCNSVAQNGNRLFSKFQTSVTAVLFTSAPKHFPEVLNLYFKSRLEEFSKSSKMYAFNPTERSDSEREDDEPKSGLRNCGDNAATECVSSNRQTPDLFEDMEINGNGCLINASDSKLGDPTAAHDMEDIFYPSISEFKYKTYAMQDVAEVADLEWVEEISGVVQNLKDLGFAAMSEEAYASAIYSLLKAKIYSVANKNYEKPVLASIRWWIKAVPLRFLRIVLNPAAPSAKAGYSGLPSPLAYPSSWAVGVSNDATERVVRWHLRLEFFAYETLGSLRINELFDIIVDYPESLAAIDDLRQCLVNTGQHAKLVDSFRTALKHRLLTAGAATTDILLQYVSTIKALRTMDPTGVFLEAVGEPIREYLKGRKDTIRCVVTMLTDDTCTGNVATTGATGESLLEELSRETMSLENVDNEDEGVADNDEAWSAAERWEPDPVEADPSQTSKSRRSMDIIGMLVGIYGSKELFVNEYRVMLAEKLLNKFDYDIDRDIRTLELLKLHFGESSMHVCEIMLKDITDSKRINSNIKASVAAMTVQSSAASPALFRGPVSQLMASSSRSTEHNSRLAAIVARARGVFSQTGQEAGCSTQIGDKGHKELALKVFDATIISSLFWPPFQAETIVVPEVVDNLFKEYAQRYHALRAPRKLQWKQQLGVVKLELQFEDRSAQFVVSPLHASIIMLFEGCSRWAATDLAVALGLPVTTLQRRITLWLNQGVLVESSGVKEGELYYDVVENMVDMGNHTLSTVAASDSAVALLGEEEGGNAVASTEDQWQQEMNVYESYVVGMLTNFDALPLDRIHNMLKMFVSDPPYDKTFHQLQVFLGRLVSEEKLEIRDGLYRKKQ